MAVESTAEMVDRLTLRQLTTEFSSRVAPDVVRRALTAATRDLAGSIRGEALPQMAFALAQYRLSRIAPPPL